MWNKIMLFISSYIPLYVLLIIKNILERATNKGKFIDIIQKFKVAVFFDEINDYAIIVLSIMCVSSFLYLYHKLKDAKGGKFYTVTSLTDETSNYYFSYISIYLLSSLGLSLNNIVDNFVFLFLMVIVGYIYISNNMVYMNPIINFIGYKVFDCTLDSKNTNDKNIQSIIVINKKMHVKMGDEIDASGKSGFIFVSNIIKKDE